jgi:hypothetical protein
VVGLKSTSRRDEIVARGRGARIGIDENLTPNQLENKRRIKYEVRMKNECEDWPPVQAGGFCWKLQEHTSLKNI